MTIIATDAEQAESAAFVVCVRVADLTPIDPSSCFAPLERIVRARSIVQPCCDCQSDILADHENLPKKPPRICIPCVQLRLAAGSTVQ